MFYFILFFLLSFHFPGPCQDVISPSKLAFLELKNRHNLRLLKSHSAVEVILTSFSSLLSTLVLTFPKMIKATDFGWGLGFLDYLFGFARTGANPVTVAQTFFFFLWVPFFFLVAFLPLCLRQGVAGF